MTKPRRRVRYEDLPVKPAPSAEVLCAAMYDVLAEAWGLLEGEVLDALPRRSRRFDADLLRQRVQAFSDRAEYLCKRCYGDGWEAAFELAGEPRLPKRTPPWWRTKGRRRRERFDRSGALYALRGRVFSRRVLGWGAPR